MTRSIRLDFNSETASLFLDDIQLQKSHYHYFIGKTEEWGVVDRAPTTPISMTYFEDNQIRKNSLYFRKIGRNDVSMAVARFDWTEGEVVTQWDDTKEMVGEDFYRLTEANNVYVCLDNAESGTSTIEPTGTSFYPFRTADGYLWKYLYTVPSFKRRRFSSVDYMPIQRALTDSFYNKGSVEDVVVLDEGSGYVDAHLTYITVSGAFTGAGATVSITGVNGIGAITSVSIGSGGSGYTAGCKIVITAATGYGAVLTPTIVGGVITAMTITDAGIGYTVTDTISVTVGGMEVLPIVSAITGQIMDVKIINPGSGYTTAPTLTVHALQGTQDGLYSANTTAVLEAIIDGGSLKRVLIRDPGVGYPVDTSTQIVVQGDGANAAFTPVIYDGKLVDVLVENSGEGYNTIILNVLGNGTGASCRGVITESDFESEQAIVEQTAVPGAIHSIKMLTPGQGYSSTTTVTVTGDGTGFAAYPIVQDGQVKRIVVTSPGLNYTRATVTISDVNRVDLTNTVPTATAYAVLPPIGGHGKDAVNHLFANVVAIASSLRSEPKLSEIPQEYRQFGLMKDTRTLQTGKTFKLDSELAVFKVGLSSIENLVIDEVLVNASTKFRVINIQDQVVTLQPLSPRNITPLGSLFAETNNARSYVCNRVISSPVVDKYSGRLLYVSNENPFAFTENQGILIKTFLKF